MSDPECAEMLLQAAGKSPKARLAPTGEVYPLTHNIELLLDRVDARRVATTPFCKLIDRASALTIVVSSLEQVRLELAQLEVV